ncbi:MAG: PAS:Response regulator receiver:ATP-binding region ATPase-like:Histidine kinase A-like protein [Ignavibacteria bacterium]|nr:MAG: PAS:Response regulator receiver:ATP-binding region ATPase-like:Histidine kinase A-like protein [Ignavibacteria bacterium]KAF0158677.1 MAG: PAS:Response regulator receiver:ATP-binding region ATPase-like:Histidine kinase A-like protein [Ignavibacteria bacterium]
MIDDFATIETISPESIRSMIVDKTGRVIALSAALRSLVPSLTPHSNFLEQFNTEETKTLSKLFTEARRNDLTVTDKFDLVTKDRTISFEVIITPLKSENNLYFNIIFDEDKSTQTKTETKKFKVASIDLDMLSPDSKIPSIIERIKLSFPFSFIEKAKIQKEINDIEEYFWLKDVEGKLLLINDKYAAALGYKTIQLENKNEADVLPKYLTDIYATLDSYVKSTTNPITIENISGAGIGSSFVGLSLIELPLSDLDNNVVAIIGFSKKEQVHKTITREVTTNPNYSTLPLPIFLLNNENKIVSHSVELLKLLSLGEQINLVGKDAIKIFEKNFLDQVEVMRKDRSITGETTFNYLFAERGNLKCVVKLIRIVHKLEDLIQVVLVPVLEKDSQLEVKANMYDALIEHSPEAMFIYDIENLRFLEVNNHALKLYGYKRTDFLNMDLTDLYAPEDIQTLIETSDTKAPSGSFTGPWRHKKSDGTSVYVELRRTSIEFKEHQAHLNLVRNVSENIEEKKKRQFLESLYENTSELLIITDKDGFVKDVNEVAIKKLGYPKRELEGRPIISLLSDDDRAAINKNIFHSGILKTVSSEVDFKKPSGSFQKAALIATPIKSYTGEVDSFSIIVRLLEEPAAVKDLQHTQEDTSDKIDASFLSNMFHEILTPINVILGFTQELGDSIESPNEEQKEAIDIIKENQKLLLQIMDNAVEYSTLEQKVIKFRPEIITFVDLLNELKEQTKKTAESKKIELNYGKISSSLTIETDKQKFIYLLSLFIKFAIQITKEKSVYLSASVYQENYCAVGVKDLTGGISQYLIKTFNEVFSDDDNVIRRNYGFSRFSIKLAKKLIDLLSVKKEIITKGGEYSEFALLFPLKFVIGESLNAEIESIEKKENTLNKQSKKFEIIPAIKTETPLFKPAVDSAKSLELSTLSCLYLEDQLDSQMLFKVQMKDLKSLEFAVSFESALPLLKTKKFDFIVMDINLQGEYNGLDALRIIQRMPGYKDIPVIASTAYVQPDARDSFIAAGFTEFISKPLLRDKIIEVLQRIFS